MAEENSVKIPGYCMLCCAQDGSKGRALMQCKSCKTLFHDSCYGIQKSQSSEGPNMLCIPCKSMGDTIKVRQRDSSGKRKEFTITERPTECCLCGVDNKEMMLPMHPLYDNSGPSGRQVVLPAKGDKPERLAWAHSICGFYICNHKPTLGCVFGTHRDGFFTDSDGVATEDAEDDSSVNSYLDEDREDKSIHHFVMHTPALHSRIVNGKEQDLWLPVIDEIQRENRCDLCGLDDRGSFRMALYCSANSPDEEEPAVSQCHPDSGYCNAAVHVGCAMYGVGEAPKIRRVFFLGCQEGPTKELNTNGGIYCEDHAHNLKKRYVLQKNLKFMRKPRKIAPSAREQNGGQRPPNAIQAKRAKKSSSREDDSATKLLLAQASSDLKERLVNRKKSQKLDLILRSCEEDWKKRANNSEFDKLWSTVTSTVRNADENLFNDSLETFIATEIQNYGEGRLQEMLGTLVRRIAQEVDKDQDPLKEWKKWKHQWFQDAIDASLTHDVIAKMWQSVRVAMETVYQVQFSVTSSAVVNTETADSSTRKNVSSRTENARESNVTGDNSQNEVSRGEETPDNMNVSVSTDAVANPTDQDAMEVEDISAPYDWSHLFAFGPHYEPSKMDFAKLQTLEEIGG